MLIHEIFHRTVVRFLIIFPALSSVVSGTYNICWKLRDLQ
jgi:hypothetical protein